MNAAGQSEINGSMQHSAELSSRAIDGKYYNITDSEAWPVAGLLVLLDGQGQPVRAELHLYEGLPSHIQEGAVGQSREILQTVYSGDATLPLRILQTGQMRDTIDVRLGEEPTQATKSSRKLPVPLFAVMGIVAMIAIVLVAALALRGSQGPQSEDQAADSSATVETVMLEMVSTGASLVAGQDAVERIQPDLPASTNARFDLQIGARVAIVPGLQLTLRSEPGADAGVPIGYMMDDDTAIIAGGPELTEGLEDTIVWWLVNLDDGTEAWAPANTSDKTLLIPVQ